MRKHEFKYLFHEKKSLHLDWSFGLFSCTTEDDVCCEDTVVPIEIPAVVDCEEANALSFVGVIAFCSPNNGLYTETLEEIYEKL